MLQNNVGLLTPVNYYEDNYPCKISISCQCTIALVFVILSLIGLGSNLAFPSTYTILSSLIFAAIYYLLYKNLRKVKDKYQRNIHPCTEKSIIEILSGIVTVYFGIQIILTFIIALSINKNYIEDFLPSSYDSDSLEDIANAVKIGLFVALILEFIIFVLFLLIFINSFHIN
jgi:hypothetical protein